MSYITQSLAAQRAIMTRNQAEAAIIRSNQAQQDLIGKKGNFNDIARKEAQIECHREANKTKAQAAYAQQKAMKEAGKHKINYRA